MRRADDWAKMTAMEPADGKPERRKTLARRQVERRAPKPGVNVRHDDPPGQEPKRVRRGQR